MHQALSTVNKTTAAIMHKNFWEEEHEKTYSFDESAAGDNKIIIKVYPALVNEKRFK